MNQYDSPLNGYREANPVLKAIVNRRLEQQIPNGSIDRNLIEILLNSGMRITTSHPSVPWSYAVIQDDDYIRYLQDYATVFNQLNADLDGKSPNQAEIQSDHSSSAALIIMYANVDLPFTWSNCWQAIENILLTASALGLSMSLDSSLLKLLNSIKIKQELQVPDELSVMYAIYVSAYDNTYLPAMIQKPTIWSWIHRY